MINNELLQYIIAEQGKGTPRKTVVENLATQGWNTADVAEAFQSLKIQEEVPEMPASKKEGSTRTGFIAKLFATKGSSFFVLVLIGVLWNFFSFQGVFAGSFLVLPVVYVIIVVLLRVFKYRFESENVLRAIGMIFLTLAIIGLIGFGLCLIALH